MLPCCIFQFYLLNSFVDVFLILILCNVLQVFLPLLDQLCPISCPLFVFQILSCSFYKSITSTVSLFELSATFDSLSSRRVLWPYLVSFICHFLFQFAILEHTVLTAAHFGTDAVDTAYSGSDDVSVNFSWHHPCHQDLTTRSYAPLCSLECVSYWAFPPMTRSISLRAMNPYRVFIKLK